MSVQDVEDSLLEDAQSDFGSAGSAETLSQAALSRRFSGPVCELSEHVYAKIDIHVDGETSGILEKALAPEALNPSSDRVKVTIERTTGGLKLEVFADDTVSARAALNSYLRWMDTALKTVALVRDR